MKCTVVTQRKCTRNGDTIRSIAMIFDVDITAKLFFWESRNDFRKEVYKKSLGDGLYIIGENVLVVTGGLEIREAGSHSAHLKCIDEDGTHTIYKWEITVKPKKV